MLTGSQYTIHPIPHCTNSCETLTGCSRVREREILHTRTQLNISNGGWSRELIRVEPIRRFALKSPNVPLINLSRRDCSDRGVQGRTRECREEIRKEKHGSSSTRPLGYWVGLAEVRGRQDCCVEFFLWIVMASQDPMTRMEGGEDLACHSTP